MKVLCRSLLLGMTGSISAPSIPGFVAFLRRGLVEQVRVIMTRSAAELVTPAAMQAYTGEPVYVDSFDTSEGVHVPHIQLAREADAFLIMPASANVIAKAGLGIADDLLSTAILASPAPVIIVPCMNEKMWFNRAVQRNVALARENGYHVMEPVKGFEVADLQETFGAMPPFSEIIAYVAERIAKK